MRGGAGRAGADKNGGTAPLRRFPRPPAAPVRAAPHRPAAPAAAHGAARPARHGPLRGGAPPHRECLQGKSATGAGPRGASPAFPSPPSLHPSSICFDCFISLSFPLPFPSSAGRGGSAVLGREAEEEEDVDVDVPPPPGGPHRTAPAPLPPPPPAAARSSRSPRDGRGAGPPLLCVGMGAGQHPLPPLTPSPGHFGPPFPFSRYPRAVSSPLSSAVPRAPALTVCFLALKSDGGKCAVPRGSVCWMRWSWSGGPLQPGTSHGMPSLPPARLSHLRSQAGALLSVLR